MSSNLQPSEPTQRGYRRIEAMVVMMVVMMVNDDRAVAVVAVGWTLGRLACWLASINRVLDYIN